MVPQLDVGKLVGAASAPVALIIAAAICLGNLGGRYSMLAAIFKDCTREYRGLEDRESVRAHLLEQQIEIYSGRLRLLMRGTVWLGLAILSFVLTVASTSIGVLFPKATTWTWLTGSFSFAGLFFIAGFVIIQLTENHRARRALTLELAEFSKVSSTVQ